MHVPWRCTTPLRLSWSKGNRLFFGINCPEGFFVHVCNGCFAMIIIQDSRFALDSSGCLSGGHTLVGMVVVPRQPNDVIVYPKMDSSFSTYFSALPKTCHIDCRWCPFLFGEILFICAIVAWLHSDPLKGCGLGPGPNGKIESNQSLRSGISLRYIFSHLWGCSMFKKRMRKKWSKCTSNQGGFVLNPRSPWASSTENFSRVETSGSPRIL